MAKRGTVPAGLKRGADRRALAAKRAGDRLARQASALVDREVRAGRVDRLPDKLERLLRRELRAGGETGYRAWRRTTVKGTPRARRKPTPGVAPDQEAVDGVVNAKVKGETWRARLRADLAPLTQARGRDARAAAARQVRARVQALARTEYARVDNAMRDRATRDVAKRVVAWEYRTQRDDRVRAAHRALDGRRFPVGTRRIPVPNGPGCRCFYVPVLE